MFSFHNITANNGWAMALAGALIVMSGLTVLSFIISQLHKIVDLMESDKGTAENDGPPAIPETFPDDLSAVADFYAPLTGQLPSSFSLKELYALAAENNFPHPHLTLRAFREAGILVAQGDGLFTWKAST